jgi:hypothetical protein
MDDAEKKAVLEKRTANRKLSEIIQQGTRYHEAMKMKLVDGQEHDVAIYPLSEEEFRVILEQHGFDVKDLGDREKMAQNMKFIEQIARVATGQENITELVLANGCAEIMLKCFEISGLRAEAKKAESFQPGDLQP